MATIKQQRGIRHVTVYREEGIYAGWPANHGAWQWGDEFLVGFIRGEYGDSQMHKVVGPLEKMQARSLDGGESWTVEKPNVDFEASDVSDPPAFDLQSNCIMRVCGAYDHGGEFCVPAGGFYLSTDRGKTWSGAYSFKGFEIPHENQIMTSRTRTLGKLVFLSSAARNHWGSDWTYVAEHDGQEFALWGIVCNDEYRAVMPAVAAVGKRLVVVCRRRGAGRRWGCWLDAFVSDDHGLTWRHTSEVAQTGGFNGNPPALLAHRGRLYCAYANRDRHAIEVAISYDRGESWHGWKTLREGQQYDIGYPQLFQRTDGKLCCVYYWADESDEQQHIEATIFSADRGKRERAKPAAGDGGQAGETDAGIGSDSDGTGSQESRRTG
jgi:hypothetical protein